MSTTQSRIQKINDRISSIEVSDRKGLILKLDILTNKTDSLFSCLENLKLENKQKFETLKKNTGELKNEVEKTKDEFFISNKIDFIHATQTVKSLQKSIDKETIRNREIQTKTGLLIEEKFAKVKENLNSHEKQRALFLSSFLENFDEEIERLFESLKIYDEENQSHVNEILLSFQNTKGFLLTQIEQEKGTREENEKAIYDMLRDVMEKIKGELGKESEERNQTEDIILTLLDEITKKLKSLTA